MGNHTPDSAVENLGRSSMMNRPGPSGVDDMTFMEETMITKFIAEEAARDVNLLTSHNNNLLPGQNLLRDYRCKATK